MEAPEGDEAVAFYDFPESFVARDKVVAGPLPVALIPQLDQALLHLKPEESVRSKFWAMRHRAAHWRPEKMAMARLVLRVKISEGHLS